MAKKTNQLTTKQKRFVELIKQDKQPHEAYVSSGYTAKDEHVAVVSSQKLLKNPKISKELASYRTQQLAKKQKLAESVQVTEEWLIQQYVMTINDSRQQKQNAVVRSCLYDVAKLCGFMVDRKELAVSGEVSHLASLDTQSLMNALTQAQQPEAIEAEFAVIDSDETGTI